MLDGKRILVTGGTGSLGKVLVRRLLAGEWGVPAKVIVFSRDEGKQHDMRLSYLQRTVTTDEVIYRNFMSRLEFRIGDVRDFSALCSAVKDADLVVNAAALKQVPTCEYFPIEAVRTNCLGAQHIVDAIRLHGCPVETVVGVSTDKACKPTNLMGLTKAVQERILIAANILCPTTRFVGVRYGNIMASRGSVIPLFHELIRHGEPVTVTDPRMTRFLITLHQATDLIMAAVREAGPGEIYVPRAPSCTMEDLARALVGDRGNPVRVTGIRPGEKVHEIMVSEEESHHTVRRGPYYAILPMLPELRREGDFTRALDGEYSSGATPVGLDGVVEILGANQLLLDGEVPLAEGGELLR
ncbi:MAG: polysaccharide biosynthesis protein [bacterium]|jgi:UDP-glucose 4-epimerase|nr:polysaccharide biosynthesis protein [bacterium]